MKPNPVHRLPAPLEAAIQRLKLAAREAAERTIESLGLAALAAGNAYQRDGLLGAQFELNRKSAVFALTFNDALDQRVLREITPRPAADTDGSGAGSDFAPLAAAAAAPTDWASLSLVDDQEVEAQISAERFGMDIAHACEWELRELDAYVSTVLGEAGGERDRNPLRPDLIGHAMIRGIAAVSDREDVRKVLSAELSRSLSSLLPAAYGDIMAALRNAGVQPQSLAVRHRTQRRGRGEGGGEAPADHADTEAATGPGADDHHRHTGASTGHGGMDSRYGTRRASQAGAYAPSQRGGLGGGMAGHGGHQLGPIGPTLLSLIQRLNHGDGGAWGGDGGGPDPYGDGADGDAGGEIGSGGANGNSQRAAQPRNLIRAHRDELRGASSGALDHMVIDVIGFMFDQILADPKVPPQLARQIARLQLPVLRAALGDKTFFSSRKHPVRRFINRIASLGSAFEDFNDEGARHFLNKVRSLVQEVAEGDFDRIEIYEQKLAALEAFTAEGAAGNDQGQRDAATLLSEKEDQQRLRELYAQRLAGELKDLDAPPFLREFLAGVWSQVLLRASEQGGPAGPLVQRLRAAGRELFLSVQPKATAQHRKTFLAELPKLMQDLSEGMNLIAWPEAQRRTFFGQLMPCHAEALKSTSGRTLEINLMARQIDGALLRPPPSRAELAAAPLPTAADRAAAAPPQLTAEEAQRVGLLPETAVDWSGPVDIEVGSATAGETSAAAESAPSLPGLPETAEAADPTEGRALADHVQVGYPYRMHLDQGWQKVRLSHVSAARSFFVFTHGSQQRSTVTLTQRMLLRLCETGRLKAYEPSYLVERATARARRQLAGLVGPQAH
jgi:hypothetical protein